MTPLQKSRLMVLAIFAACAAGQFAVSAVGGQPYSAVFGVVILLGGGYFAWWSRNDR